MTDSGPMVSLTILLIAALVGGVVAHRLRQPVILGYLLVGVAVGPNALGLVSDRAIIETAATIGVALLMLTLGLEFSLNQLRQIGRVSLWGGIAQIVLTSILGFGFGVFLFQWSLPEALLFGIVIYNTSTAVSLKILIDRGELDSAHGRIIIAISIVQDVSAVALMVITPLIGQPMTDLLLGLTLAVLRSVFIVGAAIAFGLWILPWLFRIGGIRSREIFLLTVLSLCLGAALSTYMFGLPVVFGSFVIGLALRRSGFARDALSDITPLRDIFAALFFVSLGMLLSPKYVLDNWTLIAIAIAGIVVIKLGVVYGIARFFGYSGRVGLLAGAGLVQVGEFGFILAQIGVGSGVVTEDFRSLVLASAIVTMIITPLLMGAATWLYPRFTTAPGRKPVYYVKNISYAKEPVANESPNKVLIAGYGRVGSRIVKSLRDNAIDCTVIEINPALVIQLRRQGITSIYGDASNALILSQARAEQASILIITCPDPLAVISTVKNALRLNPGLKVFARLHRPADAAAFAGMENVELISPEYEASLSFLYRVLNALGWQYENITQIINEIRRQTASRDSLPRKN